MESLVGGVDEKRRRLAEHRRRRGGVGGRGSRTPDRTATLIGMMAAHDALTHHSLTIAAPADDDSCRHLVRSLTSPPVGTLPKAAAKFALDVRCEQLARTTQLESEGTARVV